MNNVSSQQCQLFVSVVSVSVCGWRDFFLLLSHSQVWVRSLNIYGSVYGIATYCTFPRCEYRHILPPNEMHKTFFLRLIKSAVDATHSHIWARVQFTVDAVPSREHWIQHSRCLWEPPIAELASKHCAIHFRINIVPRFFVVALICLSRHFSRLH